MTHEAITFIKAKNIPSSPQKLLAVMIAEHTNNTTGRCFPGQTLLAAECSMSERQVREHIAKLAGKCDEDGKYLGPPGGPIIRIHERRHNDGTQRWNSNEYELIGFLEWFSRAQEDARKPSGGNPPMDDKPTGGFPSEPPAETRKSHRRKPAYEPSEGNHQKDEPSGESAPLRSAASPREDAAAAAGSGGTDAGRKDSKGAGRKGKRQGGLFASDDVAPAEQPGLTFPATDVAECLGWLIDAIADLSPASPSKNRLAKMRQTLKLKEWQGLTGVDYVRQLAHELKIAQFPRSEGCRMRVRLDKILDDDDDVQLKFLEGTYRDLIERQNRPDVPIDASAVVYTPEFLALWNAAPSSARAGSKKLALQVWDTLAPESRHDALLMAPYWAANANLYSETIQPHVAKWLEGRYWEALAENEGVMLGFPVPPDLGPERDEWLRARIAAFGSDERVGREVERLSGGKAHAELVSPAGIGELHGLVARMAGNPNSQHSVVHGGIGDKEIDRRLGAAFGDHMRAVVRVYDHAAACLIPGGRSWRKITGWSQQSPQ